MRDAVDHGVGVAIRSSVGTIMIRLQAKNYLVQRISTAHVVVRNLDTSVKTTVMMGVVGTVVSDDL